MAALTVFVGHAFVDGPLAEAGMLAFFPLSGFLLWQPFRVGHVDTLAYLGRRLARIYPGYLLALVGATLLSGDRSFVENPATYLLMAQNYDRDLAMRFLAPAWSLQVELTFYLVLPAIALIARRHWLLLAVPGLVSWAVHEAMLSVDSLNAYVLPPLMFWAFVPGMLAAGRAPDRRLAAAGIACVALELVLHSRWTEALMPIGIGLLLPTLASLPIRTFPVVAGASYAFYLWHWDVWHALDNRPLSLVATTAIALVSWHFAEAPVLRWARSRWRPARRSPWAAAPG